MDKMRFQLPFKGTGTRPGVYISQWFGQNPGMYDQFGYKGHNGIDFTAPMNEPIMAMADGWIVEQSSSPTGYGNRVTQRIEFGGRFFILVYGHLSKFVNDKIQPYNWFDKTRPIKAGEIIGYCGISGFTTGPHLHSGLHEQLENGTRLNIKNGYNGAIDHREFIFPMTNAKLVKKGSEYGFYFPKTNEQTLIDMALNTGYPLPTINDGQNVDWANIKPDIEING